MPSSTWQGPLRLSPGPGSLPHRIAAAAVEALASGSLRPGDALPATRRLAEQLGVGRGAVVGAYDELVAAGYAEGRTGSGTFVVQTADVAARAVQRGERMLSEASASRGHADPSGGVATPPPGDLDLRPGHAEPALISTRDWRAAWRHGIPDQPGAEALSRTRHPELEAALADHLRRLRGLAVAPEEVVVVPNASAAFTVLARAAGLADRTVAVEDPGYRRARAAFEAAGARVRGVPVDDDGLDPALLDPDDAAAYLTPAHQYPLGARMPLPRRVEVVGQARHAGRLIVEDDYDGEFRYGVPPMPALRSLPGGADCVAYVGTASKILTPDLGLAWVVPPPHLLTAVRQAQDQLSLGASPVASRALAHLIDSGALGRHLARAARLYRARRDALVHAVGEQLPDLVVSGVEAGLHLVLLLDRAIDDRAVIGRLRESGIWVEPLSAYYLGPPRPGLVIGYARLPETRAPAVVGAVSAALTQELGVLDQVYPEDGQRAEGDAPQDDGDHLPPDDPAGAGAEGDQGT